MDIYELTGINSEYLKAFAAEDSAKTGKAEESFGSVLSGIMDSLNDTNDLQIQAQEEEMRFALGYADNTHDVMIAAAKASVALQYTAAVRDRLIQGYQELMQMQV